MPKKQMIRSLLDLGMSDREARLYIAMLQSPDATPTQLHRISGVAQSKIYAALERMTVTGYCTMKQEGRRKYYFATRPEDVSQLLRQSWEQLLEQRRNSADSVFAQLSQAYPLDETNNSALKRIQVIQSSERIHLKLLQLTKSCQQEVVTFFRPPYAAQSDVKRREVINANMARLKRGVRSRVLVMKDEYTFTGQEEHIRQFKEAGDEIRIAEDLPIKMFVFDARISLVTLPSVPGQTGSDFTMLAVEDESFSRACVEIFEMHWEKCPALII